MILFYMKMGFLFPSAELGINGLKVYLFSILFCYTSCFPFPRIMQSCQWSLFLSTENAFSYQYSCISVTLFHVNIVT